MLESRLRRFVGATAPCWYRNFNRTIRGKFLKRRGEEDLQHWSSLIFTHLDLDWVEDFLNIADDSWIGNPECKNEN
jgi:hypothetical protein